MIYWTPDSLAAYLKEHGRTISASYIRRLCREGRIKAEQPGRDWIISDEEAQRWLDATLREI